MPNDNLLGITVYITGEIEIDHTHDKKFGIFPVTWEHKNLSTGEEWVKPGYRIICSEDEKDDWIRQVIEMIQKDCDEEIARQMKIKSDMIKRLTELEVK